MRSQSPAKKGILVFISYAHKDEELKNELRTHLSSLERRGLIELWDNQRIEAGKVIIKALDKKLEEASIILLLISPYFIESNDCFDKEMKIAMKKHEANDACVIPIILRPTDWEQLVIGKLSVLPKGGKPVTSWTKAEDAFYNIIDNFKKIVGEQWLKESSGLSKLNQHDDALAAVDQAIESKPNLAQAHFQKGSILLDKLVIEGKMASGYEDALVAFDKAIELEPNLLQAYFQKGKLLSRMVDLKEDALAAFQKVTELEPKHAPAYFEMGKIYSQMSDSSYALAAFNEAIKLAPNNFLAHFQRGKLLSRMGKLKEALADFSEVTKLDLTYAPPAYFEMGKIYSQMSNRKEKALAAFTEAINLAPKYDKAYLEKAKILGQSDNRQDSEQAQEAYEQAINHGQRDESTYMGLGDIFLKLKKFEDASGVFSEVIRLNSKNAEAYYNKGKALSNNKQYEDALAAFNQAHELYLEQNSHKPLLKEIFESYFKSRINILIAPFYIAMFIILYSLTMILIPKIFTFIAIFIVILISISIYEFFAWDILFNRKARIKTILKTIKNIGVSFAHQTMNKVNSLWQARSPHQGVPVIYEQQPGSEYPNAATSLNNLAEPDGEQEEYWQAESPYQGVPVIYEQQLGPVYPDTATVRKNYNALAGFRQWIPHQYIQHPFPLNILPQKYQRLRPILRRPNNRRITS